MTFILSYGLIALAAFFNAFMDTISDVVAFNASIFKNWDKKFWCKEISWQYAKKIFGWHPDGWHFAKTFMVICIAMAIVIFRPHHQLWVHFISIGAIWNGSFSFFYWLFKSNTWKSAH